MTEIALSDKKIATGKVAAIAVLTVKDDKGDVRVAEAPGLASSIVSDITRALKPLKASGKSDEVIKITVPEFDGVVLAVGAGGDIEDVTADVDLLRRASGAAARALTDAEAAAFSFPAADVDAVVAIAEGIALGAYTYGEYKSSPAKPLKKATICTPASKDAQKAVDAALLVADSQNWARDLVNMPALDLYPDAFANIVRERVAGTKIKISVMDEKALAKAGCGGLIGVGRGSARPPRLVTMTYKPSKAKRHIAIVGKGITFDSGGLCIKPASGMATMKCDMGGAAAVAGFVEAVARLELPVAVTGYLCLAENMTGADAQRPGDVIRMHNGTTVEIDNTDAEGRLVMADGLCYASEEQPDLIIDIATLTGAAVVALGARTAAIVGNNDPVRDELIAASERVGEHMWPMPLLEHIRSSLDSDVADLKHTGTRDGGLITAAMFLQEFIGKDKDGRPIDWIHMDIAAPAFNEGSAYGFTPKGGTGFAVRSLVELATER